MAPSICYTYDYEEHDSSCELLIILSPTSKFSLRRRAFDCSVLYIADRKMAYYMNDPEPEIEKLASFITKSGFSKITFLGGSKGATGCLLWSGLLSDKIAINVANIRSLAFAPQSQIYPRNKNLNFPSYEKYLKRVEQDKDLCRFSEIYGNICDYICNKAVDVEVFHSSFIQFDIVETARLQGNNIKINAIDLPFHSVMVAFLTDLKCDKSVVRLVNKLYEKSETDKDLAASLPREKDSLYTSLKNLDVPSIDELINS